ncbi:MAG TPA: DNA internalization-related competence protein ComEC/Rec2 [Candidatus Methylomirabilis sp.]|nr:DNA internalization-related competence protein ComEC/Rec2 [Candidatus Methylomirabilis sp.]
MPRPLLGFAAAFAAGALLADRWRPLPAPLLALLAVLLLGAAIWWRTRRPAAALLALLTAFAAIGALRLLAVAYPPDPTHLAHLPADWTPRRCRLSGRIVHPPEEPIPEAPGAGAPDRIVLSLEAERLACEGASEPVTGGVRLALYEAQAEYRPGDRVEGTFTLRRPRGTINPGGFDYRRFRQVQGVALEGWAREIQGELAVEPMPGARLGRAIAALRRRMLVRLQEAVGGEEGALVRAIVLGDRSGLSEATVTAFRDSGTYHILAISGLNVSLLAGAFLLLLRGVRAPPRASAAAAVLLVVFYAVLAGGSPSVIRAAVMTAAVLFALILERQADLWSSLGLAALLLLAGNPLSLFDAGFQLTFAATAAIAVVADRMPLSQVPRPARWVLLSLAVSGAAALGTLPVLAVHFQRVSLSGVLANLPIVPLSGVLTALGMLEALALALHPAGLPGLGDLLRLVAATQIAAARLFAGLPLATLQVYPPTLFMIGTYYALALSLSVRGPGRWRLPLAGLLTLALLGQVGWKLLPSRASALSVTFLDVGEGDSILVEAPGGRLILVDGGGVYDDRFDVGDRIVVPYILSRWRSRLDLVVLTHPQPDHLNGLQAVLRRLTVAEVWESGIPSAAPAYRFLVETLRARGIPLRAVAAGATRSFGADTEVTVLHPPAGLFTPTRGSRASRVNNNSVVLLLRHADQRLLLTGDVEAEAEAHLVANGPLHPVAVLKVPHHGSRTSSTDGLLQVLRPSVAVIQVGFGNRFGHPHPEVLARLRQVGARILRTDRHGAVRLFLDGGSLTVVPTVEVAPE